MKRIIHHIQNVGEVRTTYFPNYTPASMDWGAGSWVGKEQARKGGGLPASLERYFRLHWLRTIIRIDQSIYLWRCLYTGSDGSQRFRKLVHLKYSSICHGIQKHMDHLKIMCKSLRLGYINHVYIIYT
jgi:hypothetical protein